MSGRIFTDPQSDQVGKGGRWNVGCQLVFAPTTSTCCRGEGLKSPTVWQNSKHQVQVSPSLAWIRSGLSCRTRRGRGRGGTKGVREWTKRTLVIELLSYRILKDNLQPKIPWSTFIIETSETFLTPSSGSSIFHEYEKSWRGVV